MPLTRLSVVRHAMPWGSSPTTWVVPSGRRKLRVPVGVPLPGATAVTVAHTVTVSPQTDGFGSTDTVTALVAGSTVTSVAPVDGRKQLSPVYETLTVPVSSVVVVTQAVPSVARGTVSSSPPGAVKVTEPVGVPLPGATAVTVAHTVTVSPHTDGFGSTTTDTVLVAGLTPTSVISVEVVKQLSPL